MYAQGNKRCMHWLGGVTRHKAGNIEPWVLRKIYLLLGWEQRFRVHGSHKRRHLK